MRAKNRRPWRFALRVQRLINLMLMVHHWLLGTWRLLRADPTLDFAPGVRMEFLADGRLIYHIDVGGTDQSVELLYRVEGDHLYTENPSAPHSMAVRIVHGEADVLILDFAGAQAVLVREDVASGSSTTTPVRQT